MNVPLPYRFPSPGGLPSCRVEGQYQFELQICNDLDRENHCKTSPSGKVVLVPRSAPKREGVERESPPSLAVITEVLSHKNPSACVENSQEKILDAIRCLNRELLGLQKATPFLVSWLVHPVTPFELGTVNYGVVHFCPTVNSWAPLHSGIANHAIRQMLPAVDVVSMRTQNVFEPAVDLCHEILAESQMSLLRGASRLTVIGAATAVEILANAVFRCMYSTTLTSLGVAQEDAEAIAETIRRKYRTDEKSLLYSELFRVCGRSLEKEKTNLYQKFINAEREVRHDAAHKGVVPQPGDAREFHKTCCEVVQWLCGVANWPTKQLAPPPSWPLRTSFEWQVIKPETAAR